MSRFVATSPRVEKGSIGERDIVFTFLGHSGSLRSRSEDCNHMSAMSQRTEVPTVHFDATLSTIHDWTILRLPQEASEKLPSRGQVVVQGTINGHRFQTVLEPDGSSGHWVRIDRDLQHTAAVRAGDTARLEIEPLKGLTGARRATGL